MYKVSIPFHEDPPGTHPTLYNRHIRASQAWSWCDQNVCLADGKLIFRGTSEGQKLWQILASKQGPYVEFFNLDDAIRFRLQFDGYIGVV